VKESFLKKRELMTIKKYLPTKSFKEKTQKINEILKEIKEEMKETQNECTILLSIVINPEGSSMGYEYLKTIGDIDRNLQSAFKGFMEELKALNPPKGEKTH